MDQRLQELAAYCDTEVMLAVVGGKWKLLILFYLFRGTYRFSELQRALPSEVTHRMLARQLRALESDGLVHRTVYPEVPPRVEYELTPVGRSLEPLIGQVESWGAWYREYLREMAAKAED
ncbi:winged helix-turn-helix transcriptional regulator [Streptomyces sp. YU58]|uniref:winged helix-turn-helix transcriptional regulator n=1 Tax=Streptomyces sp. SX92 TaxID=3158972 RepID=UPI0027B95377|nr:helix-turn-helix domain-containing protein [Streptomyces coralus]WLW54747.1 helix-turn-helix domain-containing protein [Streptomyces coralus]